MTKATGGDIPKAELKPDTKLTTGGRDPHAHHGYVNTPVYHASTLLYRTAEDFLARRGQYFYGRRGTPTSEALGLAIQGLEGPACAGVALVPSGLAAISAALLSALRSGDHVLVTDNCYGPTRKFCESVLSRFGVTTTYYDPSVGGGIAALMQPNTRAVFTEAPGSLSFEMQDIPAIAAAAHARGALVLMDNTWASPLYFRALEKGVDLSIQSATKYIGGHSDLMIGTVSANEKAWPQLKDTVFATGLCVGPDDMNMALRGLRTLSVRLARHQESGLAVARWLEQRPEVLRVLHPAIAGRSGPRHLAARLHRRLRPVRRGVQAGAGQGRDRLPQCADALRHGRVMGRLREPRHSVPAARTSAPRPHGRRAGRACAFTSGWRTSAI